MPMHIIFLKKVNTKEVGKIKGTYFWAAGDPCGGNAFRPEEREWVGHGR